MLNLAWMTGTHVGIAEAKDIFKDEAGRVIYTIDDEGIVSMFENSASDITLSVTRGTQEQMQPSVTEVKPNTVAAGTYTMLQLRGKNLVGAKVALSIPQIEIGEFLARPRSLDLPIRVPPTVQAADVTLIVMTPIGRAQIHFAVTEPRQPENGTIPSRESSTGKQPITTAAPSACPDGMIGIAAERGGFCIDIDQTFSGDLPKAEKSCSIAGKRLCVAAEWHQACEQAQNGGPTLKNMIGDWEWTSSIGTTRPLTSVLVGQTDCTGERFYQTWKSEIISGRCCK